MAPDALGLPLPDTPSFPGGREQPAGPRGRDLGGRSDSLSARQSALEESHASKIDIASKDHIRMCRGGRWECDRSDTGRGRHTSGDG
jgi:hypothetical protein